jgi:hypothetical protein
MPEKERLLDLSGGVEILGLIEEVGERCKHTLVGLRICLEIKPLQEKILRHMPGKAKDELTG